VLDIFAGMYRAGGAPLDLSAQIGSDGGARPKLIDRLAAWYVARKQRSG